MEISAKILQDSINTHGNRLTTLELVYPRFIHAEMCRHRVFSRTVESSRAKPINLNIKQVKEDPFIPHYLTLNEPGMVGHREISDPEEKARVELVLSSLASYTASTIEHMAKEFNLHKQVLNRYLEPFIMTKEVVTATEWNNFFRLRLAEDAEPHIRELAQKMKEALDNSEPELIAFGKWHLPYITKEEKDKFSITDLIKVSAARCARCSYKAYDGTVGINKDLALFNKLVQGNHMSPLEHVATPNRLNMEDYMGGSYFGNFKGWKQIRYIKGLKQES